MSSGLDPAQTGKITAALDEQGIAYELRSNGTALAVDKAQVGQARVALAAQGVNVSAGWRRGLGALRQAEARRLRLPAEGHLPARARGRDRPDDQRRVGRQRRPGAARAARGRPVRRHRDARHRRGHARQPGRHAGVRRRRAASPSSSSSSVKGLKKDNVTITDSTGQLLWPQGDAAGGAGGAGSSKQAAEARYDRALEANLNSMLDQHARRRQGPRAGQRRPQRRPDDARRAHVRQEGRAADGQDRVREAQGRRGPRRRHRRHRREHPAATPRAARPAARATPTTSARRKEHRLRRRQDGLQDRRRPGRRQQAQRRAAGRQVGRPPPAVKSLQQTHRAPPPASTPTRGDAITVTQIAFAKPAVARRRARCRPTLLGPIKWAGLGLGHAAVPVLHAPRAQEARGRGARRAGMADRDRGARRARRSSSSRRASSARPARSRCPRACPTPRCASSTS